MKNGKVLLGGLALAAAAGAYFLYGTKEGAKKRKKMRSWMLHLKADVMEKLEDLKEVSEDSYKKVVDEVKEKYKSLKQVDPEELEELVTRLKTHWDDIQDDLDEFGSTAKKIAKKIAK